MNRNRHGHLGVDAAGVGAYLSWVKWRWQPVPRPIRGLPRPALVFAAALPERLQTHGGALQGLEGAVDIGFVVRMFEPLFGPLEGRFGPRYVDVARGFGGLREDDHAPRQHLHEPR